MNCFSKKKYLFIIITLLSIIGILGGSYAWFSYIKESSSQQLIAGDIYLHLDEGNDKIALTNVFPETKEEAIVMI